MLESLGLSDTDAGRVELLITDDMAKAPSLIKSLALLRSPYRSPDAPRTDQRPRRPLTPILRCADDGLDRQFSLTIFSLSFPVSQKFQFTTFLPLSTLTLAINVNATCLRQGKSSIDTT